MLTRVEINGSDLECKNLGGIEIEYTQSSEDACFQIVKELGSKLMFTGVQYDSIKTLTSSLCNKVTAVLYQNCDGVESVFFNGFFTKTNCEFNDDICQVEIEIEDDSKYNCFIKSWENEINILQTPGIQTVTYQFYRNLDFILTSPSSTPPSGYGTIGSYSANSADPATQDYEIYIHSRVVEVTACLGGISQPPDNNPLWAIISNNCSLDNTTKWGRPAIVGGSTPDVGQLNKNIFTQYVTFDPNNTGIAGPPNSSLNNPVLLGFIYLTFTTINPWSLTTGTYTLYAEEVDLFGPPNLTVDNGRNLDDVFQYMLDQQNCGLTFESRFYGTSGFENDPNPVTNLTNSPTSGLLLFQKSDVADFSASENATIANISIKTLLSDLNVQHNSWWQIDEVNNKLIFEHWKTLNDISTGLDITQDPYSKTAKHNNSYTFSKASIPNKEEFKYAVDSNDVDFNGLNITYDASCAGSSSIKRQTQQICTDWEQVFNNPEFETEGLMIVQPLSLLLGGLKSQNGRITGVFKPNAPLGYGATLPDYYTYNRPLNEGIINNSTVIFDSTERLKNLKEITINFCCAFDDATKLITTYQGVGLLQSGIYNPLKKTLTLNIITEL